jgi:Fe-S oxidoreductase
MTGSPERGTPRCGPAPRPKKQATIEPLRSPAQAVAVTKAMSSVIPIRYIEPVYRPPSEAQSLILPITDGCSWNRCTFCEMYTAPQKRFRARDEAEVLESIARTGERFGNEIRRVFLADGDALVLPTRRLLAVLDAIRQHLPAVRRVSSYCLPRNLRRKSVDELSELAAAGLSIAYVGAESGDDEVLARVGKGETFASTRAALDKLGAAGITRSVMILNGLGGPALSLRHAENSARLVNATQPEYLATLVVSFPLGEERFRAGFPDWRALSQRELFVEMDAFLDQLQLTRTVFRSDHASNWLVLKGTLGADKQRLLKQVRQAIADPQGAALRPDWARGL